jgi:hypothetical protein
MKVVLVDCLIYRGLPRYRQRHAVMQSDRDEPVAARMKWAHYPGELIVSNRLAPEVDTRRRGPTPARSARRRRAAWAIATSFALRSLRQGTMSRGKMPRSASICSAGQQLRRKFLTRLSARSSPSRPPNDLVRDLIRAHGLPCATDVAIQPGLEAVHRISTRSKELSRRPVSTAPTAGSSVQSSPFRYLNFGPAACISSRLARSPTGDTATDPHRNPHGRNCTLRYTRYAC